MKLPHKIYATQLSVGADFALMENKSLLRKISLLIRKKKMKIFFAFCIVLLTNVGFASVQGRYLEVLRGYIINSEGIVFQVFSGGCGHAVRFSWR